MSVSFVLAQIVPDAVRTERGRLACIDAKLKVNLHLQVHAPPPAEEIKDLQKEIKKLENASSREVPARFALSLMDFSGGLPTFTADRFPSSGAISFLSGIWKIDSLIAARAQ